MYVCIHYTIIIQKSVDILFGVFCRFLSFSGSADLSGNGISLSVSSVLKKGAGGRFQLANSGCAFNIGSLSVKFHGGAR